MLVVLDFWTASFCSFFSFFCCLIYALSAFMFSFYFRSMHHLHLMHANGQSCAPSFVDASAPFVLGLHV
ncbi:hypothetical protein DsansV1_C08g0086791 [Dioscorea sansibarensis]